MVPKASLGMMVKREILSPPGNIFSQPELSLFIVIYQRELNDSSYSNLSGTVTQILSSTNTEVW